jgi:hypothetical protein
MTAHPSREGVAAVVVGFVKKVKRWVRNWVSKKGCN